ncbi:MAG: MarR family transcriptional regulator [Frankiaceae bacterium]|jgi:DNA-binding MarR family transcriptional regulator|nr:MarR family transcriptional regulator [Frankiaceae bacterium]
MAQAVDEHDLAVSDLRAQLVVLMRRSRSLLIEAAQRVHPDLDATAFILLVGLREQGRLRGSDLALRHDLDPAAVSRQVRRMVELGLVRSAVDPQDSRAKLLALTEDGERRLDEVRNGPGAARISAELTHWPIEQVRSFEANLRRYNALLDE